MSIVGIAGCDDYEAGKIDRALRLALSYLGDLKEKIKPGSKILIKPNMLMAASPESAIPTHPLVLVSMIRIVKECGAVPFVGDNPGNAYANVGKALEITGFREAAEKEGAEILSLSKPVKHGDLYVAEAIFGMDAIIDLAKLKTHNLTLFTGCIKNMFGIVPGFYKGEIHCRCPYPEDFSAKMVEIFAVKKPVLGVMDAVYGMEGHGPSGGTPRKIGLLMASFDCVALDAVSSKIIGYDPLYIDTTRIACVKGLGEGDIRKIDVRGADIESLIVRDFKHADNAYKILKGVPKFLYPFFQMIALKFLWVHPAVIKEKCTGCRVCFDNCPVKAITMAGGKASINYKKCVSCYCCHELCPEKAYFIDRSWLARKFSIGNQN